MRTQFIFISIYTLTFFILEIFIRKITGITSMSSIIESILIILIFSILLLHSTKKFKIIITLFVFLSYIIQMSNAIQYGGWIEPMNIYLLFDNFSEVLTIIVNTPTYLLYLIIGFFGLLLIINIKLYIYSKKYTGYIFINILIIIIFILQPLRDGVFKPEKIEKRFTKDNHSLLRSSHNTHGVIFSLLISNYLGNSKYKSHTVKSYKKNNTTNAIKPDIYIYYGESLSSKYMNIFGYPKENTPFLNKIKENSKFSIIKETISGARVTMPSTTGFFHMIQHPDAREQVSSFNTSLFKYSKESGYTTSYITTQAENYMNHIFKLTTGKFSDFYISPTLYNESKYESKKGADDILFFEMIKNMEKTNKPKLLVFQPNGSHFPFTDKSTIKFKIFGTNTNLQEYENSVYYTDHILEKFYEYIKQTSKNKDWMFIITSDHGTYVDKNNHVNRTLTQSASYTVPGIIITNSETIYNKHLKVLKNCDYLFHRDISETIARVLNYDIKVKDCNKGTLLGTLLSGPGTKTVEIENKKIILKEYNYKK